MRRVSGLLLALAAAVALSVPAYADVISAPEAVMNQLERKAPLILVVLLLVVTALLVRKFSKRK